jgi:hypothetical protein
MGYGVKNNINLDLTYQEIIMPCIAENALIPYPLYEESRYNAFRCDEISGAASIDYKFVTCLSEADIVIADISTMNANAIYELGARHALKPRSTILLCAKEVEQKFNFFDITYVPVIFYEHGGMFIDTNAIQKTKECLNSFIDFAIHSQSIIPDNPIQRALHERKSYQNFVPPEKKTLYEMYLVGRKALDNNDYITANDILTQLYSADQSEVNLLLLVLARYKIAESTGSCQMLMDCIDLVTSSADMESTTSEELLGRIAAIYLRMFNISKIESYYYAALDYYRRGANYSKLNYYCPRNYCALLLRIYEITNDPNIITEYYYTAKHNAKIYLEMNMLAKRSGSYEQRFYYYYNVCDLKAIIDGEYVNFEQLIVRLKSEHDISLRQRETIQCGIEKLHSDIIEMNRVFNYV